MTVPLETGLLDNDTNPDADGDTVTVDRFDRYSANNGIISANTDGSFSYSPPTGFVGVDTFTYTIFDGEGGSDTATVTIDVTDIPNDPPVVDLNGGDAGNNYSATFSNIAVNIADADAIATDPDGDDIETLTLFISGVAADAADETIAIGGTSFALNTDGAANNLSITGATATFDVAITDNGTTFTITQNGGGDISQGDMNALLRNITYDNNAATPTSGDRTIDFTVNDGVADSNIATSTISVNNPPVANNDTGEEAIGNPVTVDVLANDTDEGVTDPADITVKLLNASSEPVDSLTVANEGTWTVEANGEITFTPDALFTGDPAPVNYQITDLGGQTSNPATVTVNYLQPGNISGVVTSSDDGSFISGVEIALLNPDRSAVTDSQGNPIVAITQGDGSYQFNNVEPGNYKIKETNLPNYIDASDSDGDNPNIINVKILDGTNSTGNNFVDTPRSTISGKVTADNNGDGTGDTSLSGVVIGLFASDGTTEILDGNNNPIIATTGTNGIYTFTNVVPGDYAVIQTNLDGYGDVSDTDGSANGDNTIAITINPGQSSKNNNFIDAPLSGTIAGTVFSDIDQTGIGNVTVGLFASDGETAILDGNNNPITATTDANGKYSFVDVALGDYTVVQTNLPGYNDVSDSDGNGNGDNAIAVSLANGESSTDNDFIDLPAPQTISGNVTTSNDTGIEGVSLRLLNSQGIPVKNASGQPITATTLADGSYSFANIPLGEYTIVQTNLPGYKNVSDTQGDNDNRINVNLTPNTPAIDNDFVDDPTLSGRVWDDSDNNGIEGRFEDGLAGVDVTLIGAGADGEFNTGDDPADVVVTTDSDGRYEFDSFNYDEQYRIAFDLPVNLASEFTGFTEKDINSNGKDRVDSDADTANLDGDGDPTTSITDAFTVTAGAKGDIDAGLIKADSIDLAGTPSSDELDGTSADETIAGFKGQDTLTGGGGSDTFFMNETSEGVDVITDFDLADDKIDFSAILENEVEYSGSDPIADGYIVPTLYGSRGTMIQVNFDLDDEIDPKNVIFLAGVTDSDNFDLDNIVF